MTDVLKQGVTHVRRVEFRTTTLRQCKDKARLMAVQAAREKATELAGALGQTIGRPLSIVEDRFEGWGYNTFGNSNSAFGGGGQAETEVALGQITVSAKVTVSFELRDESGN